MHALCVCVIMCVYVHAHACVFLWRIQTGVTFHVAYRRRSPHADGLARSSACFPRPELSFVVRVGRLYCSKRRSHHSPEIVHVFVD